jgi:thiamine biosynthesis protein ThiS
LDGFSDYPILALKVFFPSLQCFLMRLVINGEDRSFGDDLTLAALVEQLGLKPDRVAVELNHNIIRRDDWAHTALHDGDRLEVVHFVGGGACPSTSARPRDTGDTSLWPGGDRAVRSWPELELRRRE